MNSKDRHALPQLLLTNDPAWTHIQGWITTATNAIEVLPVPRIDGERTLERLQVTVNSTLGAMALHTGGIRIDDGWLTLLGGGSDLESASNLGGWNGLSQDDPPMLQRGFAIVAYDILGGVFAMNGGAFPVAKGEIVYFAPEKLKWQPMGLNHAELLTWAFEGDMGEMYAPFRWTGWRQTIAACAPGQAIEVSPPLWMTGPDIMLREHTVVPIADLWATQMKCAEEQQKPG